MVFPDHLQHSGVESSLPFERENAQSGVRLKDFPLLPRKRMRRVGAALNDRCGNLQQADVVEQRCHGQFLEFERVEAERLPDHERQRAGG